MTFVTDGSANGNSSSPMSATLGTAPASGDAIVAAAGNDDKETAFTTWEHGSGGVAMTEDAELSEGSGAPSNWSSASFASVVTTGTSTTVEVDIDDTGAKYGIVAGAFEETVAGQTIAVNEFTETESAQSMGVGLEPVAPVETESAETIAVISPATIAVGAATETEAAQPVAAVLSAVINSATEAENVQAVGISLSVGAVTETETVDDVLVPLSDVARISLAGVSDPDRS